MEGCNTIAVRTCAQCDEPVGYRMKLCVACAASNARASYSRRLDKDLAARRAHRAANPIPKKPRKLKAVKVARIGTVFSGVCPQCSTSFDFTWRGGAIKVFCSKRCGRKDWAIRNPEIVKAQRARQYASAAKVPVIRCCRQCNGPVPKSCTYCAACRLSRGAAAYNDRLIAMRVSHSACVDCGCSIDLATWRRRCDICIAARLRANRAKDRAIRRGACSDTSVLVDPFVIFDRDGWRCRACNVSTPRELRGLMVYDAPELDHIIPICAGGLHVADNLQLLCRGCNIDKSARDAEARLPLAAVVAS